MAPSPHFPKHSLSYRDFLLQPKNPSPPKRGKGKKRQLSLSPNQPNQISNKISKTSQSLKTTFKHSNSYSMESDPLELDQDEVLGPLPSDAEVVTLLENSPAQLHFGLLTDHEESPTAAIKTALEAKISEELGEFDKTSS
jgi:hypothetical protein